MNDAEVLFVGSFPPPFGGIASHLSDLHKIYCRENRNFYVIDFSKLNTGKSDENLHLFSPKQWKLAVFSPAFSYFVLRHFTVIIKIWSLVRRLYRPEEFSGGWTVKVLVRVSEVVRICQQLNIRMISAYHVYPDALYPYLVKRFFLPDLKYAVTVFGELQANTIQIEKYGILYKAMLEEANLLMASSQYCANGVKNLGMSETDVKVVPYGIDLVHFRRTLDYERTMQDKAILFVGQINERMGLECLLRALKEVRDGAGLNVRARIVGNDHGYVKTLERHIQEMNLTENITLHRDIPYKELKDFYNMSYLYVNTANTKLACMGLSMKEAMAAELPVIASDAGGIPEAVIDGVSGFIFHVDDHMQLASQIGRLLQDPELARKFGKAGRKRAEEIFDSNTSSHEVLDLIRKMEVRP